MMKKTRFFSVCLNDNQFSVFYANNIFRDFYIPFFCVCSVLLNICEKKKMKMTFERAIMQCFHVVPQHFPSTAISQKRIKGRKMMMKVD